MLTPITQDHADFLHDESYRVGHARFIAFPKTEADVVAVLALARQKGLPVTLQGARTGISAGCVPYGGIIMSLTHMDAALGCEALADGSFAFRVGPGMVLSEFSKMVESRRFATAGWSAASLKAYQAFGEADAFFFSPDPTERSATIGGMVACNASGARSYRYGAIRPHVISLRMVLADGRVAALRRGRHFAAGRSLSIPLENGDRLDITLPDRPMPAVKNTAGYYIAPHMDAIDLLIGSDGTLGVVTEIGLGLLPAPHVVWGFVAGFPGEAQAVDYTIALRAEGGPHVAAIEYFDGDALDILHRQKAESPAFAQLQILPPRARAAIYTELHCPDEDAAMATLLALGTLLGRCGGSEGLTMVARTQSDLLALQFLRHAVPESVNMLIARRKRSDDAIVKLGTDMAVPGERLRDVMALYRRGLSEAGLESAVWGHIGDSHLHVNILPRTGAEYRQGQALYTAWAEQVVRMGGTISAEHAVGKLKTDQLRTMVGDAHLADLRTIKEAFDPDGLLGRGTIFGGEPT